jgi:hypothetical protein
MPPHLVDFLYPANDWITEAQAHQYYDTVKNRVLNDPDILPGDTFYQTVFFPSDVMSGEDEPYDGEGLCIVYIDSDGNKAFTEVMHMQHSRIASLYRVLLERNPNFFGFADREISNLIGPSIDYLVYENENQGGPLRIMETIARRAIRQDGGRRRRRTRRGTQTRRRRNASHRRAANRRSKTRRSKSRRSKTRRS